MTVANNEFNKSSLTKVMMAYFFMLLTPLQEFEWMLRVTSQIQKSVTYFPF